LKRLGTDTIDLYQTHSFDENVRIDETLSALDDLVRQGKVRYLGCSNYPAWRLTEALWAAELHQCHRFESLQPHYNLVHRAEFERELADVCRQYRLGVIPYSPLAAGFLSGKYAPGRSVESVRSRSVQRYFTDKNWKLLETMHSVGQHYGEHSLSQVALAWLRANPLVTSAIIGPRSVDQLQDNLGATEINLSTQDQETLDRSSAWKEA
jgi:aryl-alcohol dehydrogenase-like predicted oxidoreductase